METSWLWQGEAEKCSPPPDSEGCDEEKKSTLLRDLSLLTAATVLPLAAARQSTVFYPLSFSCAMLSGRSLLKAVSVWRDEEVEEAWYHVAIAVACAVSAFAFFYHAGDQQELEDAASETIGLQAEIMQHLQSFLPGPDGEFAPLAIDGGFGHVRQHGFV